ncbi:MAG: nuclear transport factor 2 family protein [Planctomycetota bacterium]
MNAATGTSIRQRVDDLISHIQQGKILDAMGEFYAEDTAMQENRKDPVVGLARNIEREKEFLAQVKDFHGFGADAIGVDEDNRRALVESWMEFTNQEGQKVRLEQVSVTKWNADGKIAHERFYYDSAG